LIDLGVSKGVLPLLQLVIGQQLVPIHDDEGRLISRKGIYEVLSGELSDVIRNYS